MINRIFRDGFKVLTGVGTFATLHGYYKSTQDEKLKRWYEQTLADKEQLLEKLNDNKISRLQDEITREQIEVLKGQLQEEIASVSKKVEKLGKIDFNNLGASTDFKYHMQEFIRTSNQSNNTVNELINKLNNKNKFWEGGTNSPKNILENWNEMLSNLNTEQLGALSHLLGSIFILWCLFSIIAIVYGDFFFI